MQIILILLTAVLTARVRGGTNVRGVELLFLYCAYRVDFMTDKRLAADLAPTRVTPLNFNDFVEKVQAGNNHYNKAIGAQRIADLDFPTPAEVLDLGYWDGDWTREPPSRPVPTRTGNPSKSWEAGLSWIEGYVGYSKRRFLGNEHGQPHLQGLITQSTLFKEVAIIIEKELTAARYSYRPKTQIREIIRLVDLAADSLRQSELGRKFDSMDQHVTALREKLADDKDTKNAVLHLKPSATTWMGHPVMEPDLELTRNSVGTVKEAALSRRMVGKTFIAIDKIWGEKSSHGRLTKKIGEISEQLKFECTM